MHYCCAFVYRWLFTIEKEGVEIETEGVGFEPTVGFPTLDFESSALNRTQPPFLSEQKTSNAERPTSNLERKSHVEMGGSTLSVRRLLSSFRRSPSGGKRMFGQGTERDMRGRIFAPKNVTILGLPRLHRGLHIVCPKDSQRYYLLFTRIHKLFAPLFT